MGKFGDFYKALCSLMQDKGDMALPQFFVNQSLTNNATSHNNGVPGSNPGVATNYSKGLVH
ncbi:hypothetical protein A3738_16595 [Oleiphilus sp. HI0066]|nr:hypothetical protein A3738_07525 [Oleiphilus sp. HI0066]KZY66585.1 hypothetical protein A3738_16595 [Oleiphilus sp. HI0066]